MPHTPILATLGYVTRPGAEGLEVLLIRRNARPEDAHYGKVNGLGGKLEPNEDVVEGFLRELREETGLKATQLRLRGTVSWPGFGKGGEDWFGFLFWVEGFEGEAPSNNDEGSLEWHPLSLLLAGGLPLWPGDPHFLPLVFDADPRPFHGVMPYEGGQPLGWSFSRA